MISQAEWDNLQQFFLAIYGPGLQYIFVGFVAGVVGLITLIIALALLRRMLMGPVGPKS
jgi:hypothetical protein